MWRQPLKHRKTRSHFSKTSLKNSFLQEVYCNHPSYIWGNTSSGTTISGTPQSSGTTTTTTGGTATTTSDPNSALAEFNPETSSWHPEILRYRQFCSSPYWSYTIASPR